MNFPYEEVSDEMTGTHTRRCVAGTLWCALCSLVRRAQSSRVCSSTSQRVPALSTYGICFISLSLCHLVDIAADDSLKCPQVRGNCEQDDRLSDRVPGLPDSSVWSFGLMFCLHQKAENTVHPIQAQWASGGIVTHGDKLSGEMSQ